MELFRAAPHFCWSNSTPKLSLAYGLEQFTSSYSSQTHLLLAAAVLFTLPIIVVFLLAQRAFVSGLATLRDQGLSARFRRDCLPLVALFFAGTLDAAWKRRTA